jgi:hypothetical protein
VSRITLVLILALTAAAATPLVADVTHEQALELARTAALAANPDLAGPDLTIKYNYTDQVVALDISDPYRLNGQVFWKTYTHYEYTKVAVAQFSGIGAKVHATAATDPMAADVPADLRPKVMEWLAYWDSQSSLDPDLRVGAHRTTAHLFRFKRGGLMGPSAFIGVDGDGKVFNLYVSNMLVPWKTTDDEQAREQLFRMLYGTGD